MNGSELNPSEVHAETNPSVIAEDMPDAKMQAEIAKLTAEKEKIEAETGELRSPWWHKPQGWLPTATATVAIVTAFATAFVQCQNSAKEYREAQLQAIQAKADAVATQSKADKASLDAEKAAFENRKAEARQADLDEQNVQLEAERESLENQKKELEGRITELAKLLSPKMKITDFINSPAAQETLRSVWFPLKVSLKPVDWPDKSPKTVVMKRFCELTLTKDGKARLRVEFILLGEPKKSVPGFTVSFRTRDGKGELDKYEVRDIPFKKQEGSFFPSWIAQFVSPEFTINDSAREEVVLSNQVICIPKAQ